MYKKLLISILLSAIYLTGCSSSSSSDTLQIAPVVQETRSGQHELASLVNQFLKKDQGVQEPIALETIVQDDNAFLSYLFVKQGVEYEGISYATKKEGLWMIQQNDIATSDMENPFSKHTMISELQNGAYSQYRIDSGSVHDKRIRTIKLTYTNGSTSVLNLGEQQKLYLDVQFGPPSFVESITGLDSTNQEVYVWK